MWVTPSDWRVFRSLEACSGPSKRPGSISWHCLRISYLSGACERAAATHGPEHDARPLLAGALYELTEFVRRELLLIRGRGGLHCVLVLIISER